MKISGRISVAPNPCTSLPCLPGLVYAVLSDSVVYFLTRNQSFIWVENEQESFSGYKLEEGKYVTIVGELVENKDVRGNIFHQLEIELINESDCY